MASARLGIAIWSCKRRRVAGRVFYIRGRRRTRRCGGASRMLLSAYGYHLPWRVQLLAAWVPQLGKYLPGGVASVGGAVYILRKHGVPAAVGLTVAVLLDALAVLAGLIVSAPLLMSPAV